MIEALLSNIAGPVRQAAQEALDVYLKKTGVMMENVTAYRPSMTASLWALTMVVYRQLKAQIENAEDKVDDRLNRLEARLAEVEQRVQ
jgi:hypothetical protein